MPVVFPEDKPRFPLTSMEAFPYKEIYVVQPTKELTPPLAEMLMGGERKVELPAEMPVA